MNKTLASVLLVPAALATVPNNLPAVETSYDWKTQKSIQVGETAAASGDSQLGPFATFNGTQSFVGSNFIIDDFVSD